MNAPQPTSRIRQRAAARAAYAAEDAAPAQPAPTAQDRQATAAARARRGLELESSLEAYFHRCVKMQLGGLYIKLLPGIIKGLPDRLILLPGGRVKFVELKRLGERPSPIQLVVHAKMAEVGTVVDVVTGRDGIDRWVRAQYPATKELERAARARKQTKK